MYVVLKRDDFAFGHGHSLPHTPDPSRLNPLLISEFNRWAVCGGEALNASSSHSLWVHACVCALITINVCRQILRSTSVFMLIQGPLLRLHISLSSHILLSLCASAACSHLPWPWHWLSAANWLPHKSEGKCGAVEHGQTHKITLTHRHQR